MNWLPSPASILLPTLAAGAVLTPSIVHASIFVSVDQAQRDIFGAVALQLAPVVLTAQQQVNLKDVSSVSLPFQGNRIWKAADGGWFIVDEVVGKHETITYAVGLNADGSVRRVEVLEYRESYGYQVADAKWLEQFRGKTSASTLHLGQDIQNISGATLSSKHITDGIKRVLALYALVLKNG